MATLGELAGEGEGERGEEQGATRLAVKEEEGGVMREQHRRGLDPFCSCSCMRCSVDFTRKKRKEKREKRKEEREGKKGKGQKMGKFSKHGNFWEEKEKIIYEVGLKIIFVKEA
jgi:hypothetical protein